MKRLIIFSLLFAMYASAFAGNAEKIITEERSAPAFHKIEINGSVDVVYSQESNVSIKVKGKEDEVAKVITHVDDGVLNVDFKNGGSWFSITGDLVVYATSPSLEAIKIDGSGDFEADNMIEGESFKIGIYGSGDCECDLDVQNLKLKSHGSGDVEFEGVKNSLNMTLNGSGDVEAEELDLISGNVSQYGSGDVSLEGYCREFQLKQSGSGDCQARDLTVKNVKIRKSGSGDAVLTVKNSIEVKSSGSGDTHCYGNPLSVKESVSGSGELFIK